MASRDAFNTHLLGFSHTIDWTEQKVLQTHLQLISQIKFSPFPGRNPYLMFENYSRDDGSEASYKTKRLNLTNYGTVETTKRWITKHNHNAADVHRSVQDEPRIESYRSKW